MEEKAQKSGKVNIDANNLHTKGIISSA